MELAIDTEKIKNIHNVGNKIMQNMIENGSIQGILAKETQDSYILYIGEIDSNIFINKSYVIAMADIDSPEQCKETSEKMEEDQ